MVTSICTFAQDIIVTKESKKIEAKITEVTKTEIRYKELDNLDGPTFILNTDDIVTIIYATGKVVLYNLPTEDTSEREANAIAKAKAMDSLFGKSSNENRTTGNPIGRGSKGGNSWALMGRGIRGTLPQPSNTFKQEGKVIVEIRVNAAGDVVAVSHKGGTVNDNQTIQLALDAARKAKFTEGEHDQIGTITYNFKFN